MSQSDDALTKFIGGLDKVTRNFNTISPNLQKVLLTEVKLGQRYELLNGSLNLYGGDETPGVKKAIQAATTAFQHIQDDRSAYLHQLYNRVQLMLEGYEEKCRAKKVEVEKYRAVLATMHKKQDKLEKAKRSKTKFFGNTDDTIREAKVQAQKANASLEASKKKLVDSLLSHERGKVEDVKQMISDLITSQMTFFAQGLEWLTEAHMSLNEINSDVDLKHLTVIQRAFHAGTIADGVGSKPPTTPNARAKAPRSGSKLPSKRTPRHNGGSAPAGDEGTVTPAPLRGDSNSSGASHSQRHNAPSSSKSNRSGKSKSNSKSKAKQPQSAHATSTPAHTSTHTNAPAGDPATFSVSDNEQDYDYDDDEGSEGDQDYDDDDDYEVEVEVGDGARG